MTNERIVVIGTGPSGAIAAKAFVDAGFRPLVLDAGSLRQGRATTAAKLDLSNGRKNPSLVEPAAIGGKSWFGLENARASDLEVDVTYQPHIKIRHAIGIGGFSRVWGATFEFWDFDSRWPKEMRPSQEDLAAVSKLIPQTNNHSSIPEKFEKLIRPKLNFDKSKWIARASTLAIESDSGKLNRCSFSFKCLSGCPNDAIWYSGGLVNAMLDKNQIDIVDNFKVTRIQTLENQSEIQIYGRDSDGREKVLTADCVVLAAGVLSTTEIVLRSGALQRVEIKDTRTLFSAAINIGKPLKEDVRNALSQIWVTHKSKTKFQAQIYFPNPELNARLQDKIPPLRKFTRTTSFLTSKIFPIIAYLDSESSPSLVMERNGQEIGLREIRRPLSVLRSAQKLLMLAIRLARYGLLLPIIGTEYSKAGEGYHFGASLPIGKITDRLGQLNGWRGIHIVDASTLPYLEVGSITPTVMANSQRISRELIDTFKYQTRDLPTGEVS